MSADIVTLPAGGKTAPVGRPTEGVEYSDEVAYTSTTKIGFDAMTDGSVIVFREIEGEIGFVPCPDIGTAMVVVLMLHHEVKASRVAYDLNHREGFHVGAADEIVDEMVQHYLPHVRLLKDHGLKPFDEAFDRVAHQERVYDGLEVIAED